LYNAQAQQQGGAEQAQTENTGEDVQDADFEEVK